MSNQTRNFSEFYQQLMEHPLWVKQVIYAVLKQDLERLISPTTLSTFNVNDTLQLWTPKLLLDGEDALRQAQNKINTDLLKLLYHVYKKRTVMDITITNKWTLEQCCMVIQAAWEKELISQPNSKVIRATVLFLSGKIRIGEYLVQTGRITEAQANQALRTQDYIAQSMDERAGLAEIMINLNYIEKADSESILFLKQESKKQFDDASLEDLNSISSKDITAIKKKIQQHKQHIQQLQSFLTQPEA